MHKTTDNQGATVPSVLKTQVASGDRAIGVFNTGSVQVLIYLVFVVQITYFRLLASTLIRMCCRMHSKIKSDLFA